MTTKTVLAIGAHPDDEVLGAGGTLAKHADAGHAVHVLLVTEGTSQQYDDEALVERKKRDAERCARRLGVDEVHFGDLADMRLDEIPHVEVNAVIEEIVEDVRPDVVYTHSDQDVNRDHREVYESTLVATRPFSGIDRVLAYEVPSATDWANRDRVGFVPNVYVDISEYVDTKVDAFVAYESEVRDFPHPRSEESLRARVRTRGTEAGFEAAEAFSLIKEYRTEV